MGNGSLKALVGLDWHPCQVSPMLHQLRLSPQLTAFFTSALILASLAAITFVSANDVVEVRRFVETERCAPGLELVRA